MNLLSLLITPHKFYSTLKFSNLLAILSVIGIYVLSANRYFDDHLAIAAQNNSFIPLIVQMLLPGVGYALFHIMILCCLGIFVGSKIVKGKSSIQDNLLIFGLSYFWPAMTSLVILAILTMHAQIVGVLKMHLYIRFVSASITSIWFIIVLFIGVHKVNNFKIGKTLVVFLWTMFINVLVVITTIRLINPGIF